MADGWNMNMKKCWWTALTVTLILLVGEIRGGFCSMTIHNSNCCLGIPVHLLGYVLYHRRLTKLNTIMIETARMKRSTVCHTASAAILRFKRLENRINVLNKKYVFVFIVWIHFKLSSGTRLEQTLE